MANTIVQEQIYKKLSDILKKIDFANSIGQIDVVRQLQIIYDEIYSQYEESVIEKELDSSSSILIETDPEMKKINEEQYNMKKQLTTSPKTTDNKTNKN